MPNLWWRYRAYRKLRSYTFPRAIAWGVAGALVESRSDFGDMSPEAAVDADLSFWGD